MNLFGKSCGGSFIASRLQPKQTFHLRRPKNSIFFAKPLEDSHAGGRCRQFQPFPALKNGGMSGVDLFGQEADGYANAHEQGQKGQLTLCDRP